MGVNISFENFLKKFVKSGIASCFYYLCLCRGVLVSSSWKGANDLFLFFPYFILSLSLTLRPSPRVCLLRGVWFISYDSKSGWWKIYGWVISFTKGWVSTKFSLESLVWYFNNCEMRWCNFYVFTKHKLPSFERIHSKVVLTYLRCLVMPLRMIDPRCSDTLESMFVDMSRNIPKELRTKPLCVASWMEFWCFWSELWNEFGNLIISTRWLWVWWMN